MAARARVRFGSSGSRGVINRFRAVGDAAARTHRRTARFNLGIGRGAHQAARYAARFAMLSRGIRHFGEAYHMAAGKMRRHRIGRGFEAVFSALSRQFAQYRRQLWFYERGVAFYGRAIKKFGGIFRGHLRDIRSGRKEGGKPPSAIGEQLAFDLKPRRRQKLKGEGLSTFELMGGRREGRLARAFTALSGAGGKVISVLAKMNPLFLGIAAAAAVVTGGIVAVGTALSTLYTVGAYFTAKFAVRMVKGFYGIRETFRMYEISLGGIIRNTRATAKVMAFAMKYAAEYPAMFEDVIDTFRGLASMPTLKPMFRKADYDDLKMVMDIVQGLATLKPQQGVAGAMMALREALSGQMRSLRMRFEVNVREMAEEAGFSFTEITHDANKALIAIRKFVELNVPAQAMASMAMTLGTQYGNLFDKYRTFVNAMMKSTGAYWAVVQALKSLNEWLEKVFAHPIIVAFAQKVGSALRGVVEVFEKTMGLISWDKYLASGNIIGALKELSSTIRLFFATLWGQVGDDAKNTLREIIRLVAGLLWSALETVFSGIWEMIKMGFADAAKYSANLFEKAFDKVFDKIIERVKGVNLSIGPFPVGISTRKPKKILSFWEMLKSSMGIPITVPPKEKKEPKYKTPEAKTEAEETKRYKIGGFKAAMEEKEAAIRKLFEKVAKELGLLKGEPVDVGEEIGKTEDKRLKVIKMSLRQFKEWTEDYKEQKKDAEGLLAVTKRIAAIARLPKLQEEMRAAAEEVDAIGKALGEQELAESAVVVLKERELELNKKVEKLKDRIAVAEASKAEDVAKLLGRKIKAQDTILEKQKRFVEQIKKAKAAMEQLRVSMVTGIASTTVSFFNDWKGAFRLIKKGADIMSKAMIPAGLFGQGRPKVTWEEGLQRSKEEGWKGIPTFFKKLIERIKGAATPEESAATKLSRLEAIMGLYKEAAPYARGRETMTAITTKMMEMFPNQLKAQVEKAKEEIKVQQDQLTELKESRDLQDKILTKADEAVIELRKIVGEGGPGKKLPTTRPELTPETVDFYEAARNFLSRNPEMGLQGAL